MFIFVFSHLALDSIKERHSVPDRYRYPLEDTVFPRPKSVAHVTKVIMATSVICGHLVFTTNFLSRQNDYTFPHKKPQLMWSPIITANGHILKSQM